MTPMQRFMLDEANRKRADYALKAPALLQAEDSLHIKLIALNNDVTRLRALPVMAERQKMKRDELLPRWEPVAKDYLESARAYENPVLVYCIIWLLDVRRFDQALDWADIAIHQGQQTPDNIKSTLPAFVAAQVFDWATCELESGRSPEPFFSRTFENVTKVWRVNERITARYYRLAGLTMLRNSEGGIHISAVDDTVRLEQAMEMLIKARELNSKSPVKTAIDRIRMRIRALKAAQDEEKTTQQPGGRSEEYESL